MPATPYSYRQYPCDGVNRIFAVPFPFIVRGHVKVYLGYDALELTFSSELAPGVGFTWVNDGSIQTTVAQANGLVLTVIRITPTTARLVDWNDGSPPTPTELDLADLQVFYALQEQADKFGKSVETTITLLNATVSAYGFERVANVAALPATPTEGQLVEVVDSAGIEGVALVTGEPNGFIGSANLSPRLRWSSGAWTWLDYKANDPDSRYLRSSAGGGGAGGLGSNSTSQDSLNAVNNPLTPLGTIVWLQRLDTEAPAGWLYCNGVNKQRAQYNVLFNAIGTTYGVGDGSTTFGFPLEANLVPPSYVVGSSWNPFIKFGSRTSEPGMVTANRPSATVINVNFITGATLGASLTVSGVVDAVGAACLSNSGLLLTAGCSATSGRNVYIWKKSGLTYSLISASPQLLAGGAVAVAKFSPDSVYLAMVSNSNRSNVYIYKADAGFTTYSFLTAVNIGTMGVASNVWSDLCWSDDGTFLAWSGDDAASGADAIYFGGISRSGDSFTVMTRTWTCPVFANNGSYKTGGCKWSPDNNFLAVPYNYRISIMSRTGNALNQLVNAGANLGGNVRNCEWNTSGTRLVSTKAGIGSPGNTPDLWNFNGASLVAMPLGTPMSPDWGPVFIKRSPFDPNVFYGNRTSAFGSTMPMFSIAGDVMNFTGYSSAAFYDQNPTFGTLLD